jgi:hypothetical protein
MKNVSSVSSAVDKGVKSGVKSLMGKAGKVNVLGKKATCKGLDDPCIKNGTVGKTLDGLIKK